MTARTLAPHLVSLVFPAATLAFVATGPHRWWAAFGGVAVIALTVVADRRLGKDRRQPPERLRPWPFALLLWGLLAIHFVTIAALVRLAVAGGFTFDLVIATLLVGHNSGWSAIVVAHELIHRPQRRHQLAGRLILCTVLYEHFYTEHLRGHHARVGTDEDPATARYGERFNPFLFRSVTGQLRSAWRLEAHRPLFRNRVLQGFVVEAATLGALLAAFGPVALLAFVWQAFTAVSLLEAVNYLEHWGLRREQRRVSALDSWDTDSWFTQHSLIGLARHADHHVNAARPYQSLQYLEESPKLPHGYFVMVLYAQLRNDRFRALMTEALARHGVAPI